MDKKPHISLVLSIGSGGLPHYTAELANSLSQIAKVSVLKPNNTTADDYFSPDVDLYPVFYDSDLSFINIMKLKISPLRVAKSFASYKNIEILSEIEPDVVHFTDGIFPPTKGFAGYHNIDDKFPTVTTLHEVYDGLFDEDQELYKNPGIALGVFGRKILNFLTPNLTFKSYIVHTEEHKQKISSESASDVHIIPHGAYSMFSSDESIKTEENTVLFFGKIMPSKALDTVVEAIEIASETIPDIKLVVAGEGPIPKESQQIIDSNPGNFEVRNEFIPNEEVGDYFSRSKIVTVPHRHQGGHSGSLTIAFDFSKPVVASAVGEVGEIVSNNHCGLVADPEDPSDFAEKIVRLLTEDQIYSECQINAREQAEQRSWDKIAEKHLQAYKKLIEQRQTNTP